MTRTSAQSPSSPFAVPAGAADWTGPAPSTDLPPLEYKQSDWPPGRLGIEIGDSLRGMVC